ncbi:MAG: ATP-binding cassette domain-containing protein, partial [Promethearchaeota archaeon]
MILQIQSTLGISITLFLLTILITVVAILFYMNWGDKVQLIKKRFLFFILSIIPGVLINIYYIILLHDKFGDNFLNVLIIALFSSAVPVFIIKHISFRTIQYQQIRELTKLEKGKTLLQIKNLKVYYPLLGGFLKRQIGAVKAVDGVDLSVKTGETLGLVGESGCGKTTLAKAVLGLVDVEEGEMLFHDVPIDEKFTSYLRQKIQIVFQDPDASLNPRL